MKEVEHPNMWNKSNADILKEAAPFVNDVIKDRYKTYTSFPIGKKTYNGEQVYDKVTNLSPLGRIAVSNWHYGSDKSPDKTALLTKPKKELIELYLQQRIIIWISIAIGAFLFVGMCTGLFLSTAGLIIGVTAVGVLFGVWTILQDKSQKIKDLEAQHAEHFEERVEAVA